MRRWCGRTCSCSGIRERASAWLRDLGETAPPLPREGELPRAGELMSAMHEMTSGIDDDSTRG